MVVFYKLRELDMGFARANANRDLRASKLARSQGKISSRNHVKTTREGWSLHGSGNWIRTSDLEVNSFLLYR